MSNSIAISIEPAQVVCQAGDETSVRVDITNLGGAVAQCRLSVSGVDPGWARFEPDQIGAFPGEKANARLRLVPPSNAIPATYRVTIQAVDLTSEGARAQALFDFTVRAAGVANQGFPGPQPRPIRQAAGESVFSNAGQTSTPPAMRSASAPGTPRAAPLEPPTAAASTRAGPLELAADRGSITLQPGFQQGLSITLHNTGGSPLTVDLNTKGIPRTWLELSPTSVSLAPGQTSGASLKITSPSEAPLGDYPLSLIARSRDDPSVSATLDVIIELVEATAVTAPHEEFAAEPPAPTVVEAPAPIAAPPRLVEEIPEAVIKQPAAASRPAGPGLIDRLQGRGMKVLAGIGALIVCTVCACIVFGLMPPRPLPAPTARPAPTEQVREDTEQPPPPAGDVVINMSADRTFLQAGECARLDWSVVGPAETVELNGDSVEPLGYTQACPQESTTYSLIATAAGSGRLQQRVIVIYVQPRPEEPTVPPPPPPAYCGAPTPASAYYGAPISIRGLRDGIAVGSGPTQTGAGSHFSRHFREYNRSCAGLSRLRRDLLCRAIEEIARDYAVPTAHDSAGRKPSESKHLGRERHQRLPLFPGASDLHTGSGPFAVQADGRL